MNKIEQINKKIKDHEMALANLKEHLKEEQEKSNKILDNWLDIGNGIEISQLILKNKTYKECLLSLNKGEKIADYTLLQELRNSQFIAKTDDKRFIDFWAFVPNPDEISEKNNYVAGFVANSDRAVLYCDEDPTCSNASLGVFVVRKKLRGKK